MDVVAAQPGSRHWNAEPRALVSRLPSAPGVYRFRDASGRVLYIGRATDLRHRVGSYWSDLGDREHLARMVGRIHRIEAVACASAHEAAWLERNLLERSMPTWNRTPGGQEVPVYIRLDTSPNRPALRVAHLLEPASRVRYFGPYLGGLRARLAVAALDRILPLAYAGEGVRGGARDMARIRGVTAADRRWLMDAVVAVLERHPDAVGRARSALAELRDGAVASLAFERAAQIQAEADALDWITGTQRMTCDGGGDIDVFGSADGLLVHFAIRAGRLSSWSQRAASPVLARLRADSTPAVWREFAQANAELAAALAGGGSTNGV